MRCTTYSRRWAENPDLGYDWFVHVGLVVGEDAIASAFMDRGVLVTDWADYHRRTGVIALQRRPTLALHGGVPYPRPRGERVVLGAM